MGNQKMKVSMVDVQDFARDHIVEVGERLQAMHPATYLPMSVSEHQIFARLASERYSFARAEEALKDFSQSEDYVAEIQAEYTVTFRRKMPEQAKEQHGPRHKQTITLTYVRKAVGQELWLAKSEADTEGV